MEAQLTYEVFAQNVKTKFHIPIADTEGLELELTEVSEPKRTPGQEQFSLFFRGPLETFLGQGIRPFEHTQMGQFDLFIVPIAKGDEGYAYEAVFNRFTEGG